MCSTFVCFSVMWRVGAAVEGNCTENGGSLYKYKIKKGREIILD